MSRVFVAEETSLGRKVVVKVLPPDLAATVNVERFRREIQLAAQLQHPLIVPVLSSGISEGLPYYTMPLVQGESLRQKLTKSGELPVSEVVRIMKDMLSALSYAHEQGVVHRDIKPDNILLTKHHAVVTDFGVAKALSAATNPGSSLTSLGVALGTPAYMSPEQATADPTTDHRADLYAVGATAYEMLTGRQLFSGRSPQAMLAAQAIETPDAVEKWRPATPPVLSALIMRALEKHAADRPQSADEMLNVLQGLLTPSAGGMTPTATVPLQAVKPRRNRVPLWTVGAALTAIAIGAFVFARARRDVAPPLDDSRVLVAPFENKTGDRSLDPISGMATDWVTRGLSETGIVDIAQYVPTRDGNGKIADVSFEVSNVAKEARAASAGKFVTGAYYRQGDSIQFQAQIMDASDGRSLGAVTPSTSPLSSPMVAITALRARIANALGELTRSTGGWSSTQDVPPSFEAYKEFLQGEEAFNVRDFSSAAEHYQKSAKLDSSYIAPLVRLAYAFSNQGEYAKVDSIGKVLEPKRGAMSPYETHYFDRVLAWNRGDWYSAYTSAKALAAAAPKSSFAAHVAARSALPINRPAEALAGLEPLRTSRRHSVNYFDDLTLALHLLGKHDRELEVAKGQRAENAGLLEPLQLEARALAAQGKIDALHEVVNTAASMPATAVYTPRAVYLIAIDELSAHGYLEAARTFATEFLGYLATLPSVPPQKIDGSKGVRAPAPTFANERTDCLMALGRYPEALKIQDSALALSPNAIPILSNVGELAALTGDRMRAEKIFAQLGSDTGPYLLGGPQMAQARIAARLGRKDQAVQLIRVAMSRGETYEYIHTDPAFASLRGFAPYEELIKPKG